MSWGKIAAAVGLSYLGYKIATHGRRRPPSTGIRTNADCSSWEIVDPTRTQSTSEAVYKEFIEKGNDDPWDISDEIVRRVAPNCHTSEDGMRSLAEIDLYRRIFIETINRELSSARIDPPLYQVYKDELESFLIEQAEKAA